MNTAIPDTLPLLLNAPKKPQQAGTAIIATRSRAQRTLAAITTGGIGLLVTVCSVAIPLLHFILVPLCLLGTIVLIGQSLRKQTYLQGGEGVCPYCKKQITLARRVLKFPFLERCEWCSEESTVTQDMKNI